ncbi:hypothetical protein [Egicoccus halophilus]|uniref:Uncharacterized protein n=1 Tax=Egicoccus halophilus TaxID=1670830 RepID=A0A8J3A8M1_9ACTN|nr:hypothetical protein [Egicoccus halophilus]GGI06681.1 hypothetical protein GCM10011354_20310 [Egicoccus halophilus]
MTSAAPQPAPRLADGWPDVLDQLERGVVTLQAALDAGELAPMPTWAPPAGLGPLPEALRPRAERLAVRITGLQRRVHGQLGSVRAELGDVAQRRRAGTAYAS